MRKRNISILLIVLSVIVIIQLDYFDIFSHGYFTDAIGFEQIYEDDIEGYVDLSQEEYSVLFTPAKKHFAGFVLYFVDQIQGNNGTIRLNVIDRKKRIVDKIDVDLSKVNDRDDYKVYTHKKLHKGQEYELRIAAINCIHTPKMILIDNDYVSEESVDNNLLLGYAYEKSTFSVSEKTLITLFIVSMLLMAIAFLNESPAYRYMYLCGLFLFLVTVLAWNYSFNTFGYKNDNFTNFDKFSESLVTTTIKADKLGGYDLSRGLNGYTDVTGESNAYDKTFLSDNNWIKGYNVLEPCILLHSSSFVTDKAIVGNSVLFENGDQYAILDVINDGKWTKITLDANRQLNWWKNGDLSNISFINTTGEILEKGYLRPYVSQYGLQGKVYKHLARLFDVEFLNVLTSVATAIVLLAIVVLIYKKYNMVLAGSFYISFLLGPWIVNFANNLYWVEFTWFLPMLAGLFCAWKIDDRKCRWISYVATYLFMTIKCLCGYEYISTIMMGGVLFLLVELFKAFSQGNEGDYKQYFASTMILGIALLAGFFSAMLIHAPTKPGAEGSIIKGLKIVFESDFLRRTSGGDINSFDVLTGSEGYAQLASVWETIVMYFHFPTEIITGIDGTLFPVFCVIPVILFVFDYRKGKKNIELISMYCITFLATLSWLVLAKSHSYVHTHLNYVLWYFGFVQVCIYTIVSKVVELYESVKK